eukprot:scaffold283787_cov28-Tisochrysis_lutea.AAC.1
MTERPAGRRNVGGMAPEAGPTSPRAAPPVAESMSRESAARMEPRGGRPPKQTTGSFRENERRRPLL